jgi:HAD superfamily hydrolase (TIGR01549 family)
MEASAQLRRAPARFSPPSALPVRRQGLPLPAVLLCDLDGTLVDTMPMLADLATEVLVEAFGMTRSLARDLYLSTSGLPFCKQLELIAPGDPRNGEAERRYEARKSERCHGARMASATRQSLAELKSRGVRVVVSSNNGVANVEAFARASEFPFDLALGFDGNGFSKGRPHIERAARTFGVSARDMMLVGDSLHDGEIAEREGLPFVGVAGTFSKERFALRFPRVPVLDRLGDLAGLFA